MAFSEVHACAIFKKAGSQSHKGGKHLSSAYGNAIQWGMAIKDAVSAFLQFVVVMECWKIWTQNVERRSNYLELLHCCIRKQWGLGRKLICNLFLICQRPATHLSSPAPLIQLSYPLRRSLLSLLNRHKLWCSLSLSLNLTPFSHFRKCIPSFTFILLWSAKIIHFSFCFQHRIHFPKSLSLSQIWTSFLFLRSELSMASTPWSLCSYILAHPVLDICLSSSKDPLKDLPQMPQSFLHCCSSSVSQNVFMVPPL